MTTVKGTPYHPDDAKAGVVDRSDWLQPSVETQLTELLSEAIQNQFDKEFVDDMVQMSAVQLTNGVLTANVTVQLPKPVDFITLTFDHDLTTLQ